MTSKHEVRLIPRLEEAVDGYYIDGPGHENEEECRKKPFLTLYMYVFYVLSPYNVTY